MLNSGARIFSIIWRSTSNRDSAEQHVERRHVAEVTKHGIRAGGTQLSDAEPAGRHANRLRAGGQRARHVMRSVADDEHVAGGHTHATFPRARYRERHERVPIRRVVAEGAASEV